MKSTSAHSTVNGESKKVVAFRGAQVFDDSGDILKLPPLPDASAELRYSTSLAEQGCWAVGGVNDNGDVDTSVYQWKGEFWEVQPERVMQARALRWLEVERSDKASSAVARSCADTAVLHLLERPNCRLPDSRKRAILPIRGAYLEILASGEIAVLQPDKDLGITFQVPATFQADKVDSLGMYRPAPVDPQSKWGQYLDRFLPDLEVRSLLQEVTASSFLTICIEKGIFLVGSGSNGKSTFLHILRELHPRNAAVRVDKLEGQFAMSAIVNKTAIFATEMPKVLTNATQDVLKAIISRDPVQCEAKGCNPYTTVPRGTFFGSVNAWFSVSSHEHGFWRKVCAIPFSVQLAEGDKSRVPDFHRLITEDAAEMAQVLDWILAGAVRLVQRGGLPDKLPAAVEELARQNRVSSDTVAAYLEDRDVQANELVHTGKNEIYDDYREFVLVEAGKKPVAAEEFWKRVRERFPGMVFSHLTILGKKVRTASMVVENIRPIRSLMPPCSLNDTPFPDGSADGRSVPNLTGAHIPTKYLRMQAP